MYDSAMLPPGGWQASQPQSFTTAREGLTGNEFCSGAGAEATETLSTVRLLNTQTALSHRIVIMSSHSSHHLL